MRRRTIASVALQPRVQALGVCVNKKRLTTHVLYREYNRPLKFVGEQLAAVETSSVRAKVFRTQAGTLVSWVESLFDDGASVLSCEVEVHESEEALIDHLTIAAGGAESLPALFRELATFMDFAETIE